MNTLSAKLIVLTAIALLGAGCAKESKTQNNGTAYVNGYPIVPGNGTAVPAPIGNAASGSGISFTPVSLEEFNSYVATRPLNYPSDFKVAINLKDNGSGQFAGDVRLSYQDSGRLWEGVFKAENAANVNISGLRDSGVNDAVYNRWFTMGGQQVFSGFFEDEIGGIVLVIDNVVNQNDGQGGSVISGQIWYRNFAQSLAPKSSYRSCWFVYTGPYDCRSNHVISKSALYPTDSYRKLGWFSGYVKSQAFQ